MDDDTTGVVFWLVISLILSCIGLAVGVYLLLN